MEVERGGVKCNPREMSRGEVERLVRAYTTAMIDIFGPDRDIPAPDMGTGPREMAWMVDQYSRARGMTVNAVVTGKPLVLGGSLGRVAATGRGVMVSALAAMEKRSMSLPRLLVQFRDLEMLAQMPPCYWQKEG